MKNEWGDNILCNMGILGEGLLVISYQYFVLKIPIILP
jgi:hypothetical protein